MESDSISVNKIKEQGRRHAPTLYPSGIPSVGDKHLLNLEFVHCLSTELGLDVQRGSMRVSRVIGAEVVGVGGRADWRMADNKT